MYSMYLLAFYRVFFVSFSVCTAGSFGSECSGICHCAEDDPCEAVTGTCALGCADGWTGQACALPVKSDENGE